MLFWGTFLQPVQFQVGSKVNTHIFTGHAVKTCVQTQSDREMCKENCTDMHLQQPHNCIAITVNRKWYRLHEFIIIMLPLGWSFHHRGPSNKIMVLGVILKYFRRGMIWIKSHFANFGAPFRPHKIWSPFLPRL